jgi:uncharacterized protein (DUF952 family)
MNGQNHAQYDPTQKNRQYCVFRVAVVSSGRKFEQFNLRLDMKRAYKHCYVVYKIVSRAEWKEAEAHGLFVGSTDDRRDGFIHFSTQAQTHFDGRLDLLLVALDARRFGDALKWECAESGELYPHLYASSFDISAVLWKSPLPLGPDGRRLWPPEIG